MAPPAIRIATLPQSALAGLTPAKTRDWLAEATPDLVVPLGGAGAEARRILATHGDPSVPVVSPADPGPQMERLEPGGGRVYIARGESGLAAAMDRAAKPDTGATAPIDDGHSTPLQVPPVILTDALTLEIDTTALATTLHGREALARAPDSATAPAGNADSPAAGLPTSPARTASTAGFQPVVVSTGLPPDYRNRIEGVRILGAGESTDPADVSLTVTEIFPRRALQHSIDPDRLGLEALRGVGPSRASTLAEAGYETREAVAEASLAALADLDGLGSEVAATIHASARAVAGGTVVRESRASIPASDPVFVDIETDGLNPTVTWLVGVLDGGPDDGTYHSFVATDPDDPGAAIEAFVDWYRREATGRTLVAYNGREFDFPVLQDHLEAYRPALAPVLEAAETFDPYAWAVGEGNAHLPGRTNRLGDVAAGLGFDAAEAEQPPTDEPLTGAAVARTYRRWLGNPGPETEPPWDAVDAYCEGDVRALARVYQALESDASTARDSTRERPAATTQGTLSEW